MFKILLPYTHRNMGLEDWVVGLVDGEGCFYVSIRKKGKTKKCEQAFKLSLASLSRCL